MRLLLIRHAEQEQVGLDGGLTARGRQQATALADVTARAGVEAVASSPLRRAVETAAALRAPVAVWDELAEFRFGSAWRWSDAHARNDLALWRPDHHAGDESLSMFQQRVERVVTGLVARSAPAPIAICTHSGVIDAVLRWAVGAVPDTPWCCEADVAHASITELVHWPEGRHPQGAPRHTMIVRVGDVGHLADGTITGREG